MSETNPLHDDQPVDLATITADDRLLDAVADGVDLLDAVADGVDLLDAVADGVDADSGATVEAMLAAWRADLHSDGSGAERDAELVRAALTADDGTAVEDGAAVVPASRSRRRLLSVAAGFVFAAGLAVGLAVGSDHAGPTSPLWPITKVMYPEQAEIRATEHAIEQARRAVQEGRFDDARRLLAEARTHLDRISDPAVAGRLRAEIDALLLRLPAPGPTSPAAPQPKRTPSPAPSAAPTRPAAPGPAATGGSGTGGPAPGTSQPTESGSDPLLPGLPLPPLLPSPSGSPDPLLPGLPLPGLSDGGLLG